MRVVVALASGFMGSVVRFVFEDANSAFSCWMRVSR